MSKQTCAIEGCGRDDIEARGMVQQALPEVVEN
jgi:hypothetical protein